MTLDDEVSLAVCRVCVCVCDSVSVSVCVCVCIYIVYIVYILYVCSVCALDMREFVCIYPLALSTSEGLSVFVFLII